MLGHAMEGKYVPVTPLTSAKLRSAQAIVKARKTEAVGRATRNGAKQRPPSPGALPLYSCPSAEARSRTPVMRCAGPVRPSPATLPLCDKPEAGPSLLASELSRIGWRPSGPTLTPPFTANASCPSWEP